MYADELLKSDMDQNILDCFGMTPLMYAGQNGYSEICTLLLENNANPNIIDRLGDTALHHACRGKHLQTVK